VIEPNICQVEGNMGHLIYVVYGLLVTAVSIHHDWEEEQNTDDDCNKESGNKDDGK
jgi:hypothetical protein